MSTSVLPPPVRSIRFAPLPDPRRSPSLPGSPLADDASSTSSSSSSTSPHRRVSYPVESYPSPILTSPLQAAPDEYGHAPKPKRRFLLPLLRKSTSSGSTSPSSSLSLTPTPSIDNSHTRQSSRRLRISVEDILTLGTTKLFRSVYRNNRYFIDNGTPSEWELSRWASVNSAQSAPATALNNTSFLGPSLARSQSLSSKGNDNGKRNSSSARPATSGGKPSASYIKQPSRKGMRMLNGRVYGAPKRAKDPFANVRDEADPEFVEWGYGGMGSVSGRHAAGMGGTRWERLHSGQSSVDPLVDEGSGMGWVKKRREAKEREKKVKEQEKEVFDDSTTNGNTDATNIESMSSATEAVDLKPSISDSPNTRSPSSASSVIPSEEEHVLHAVTIPANFQRHHNHHQMENKSEGAEESESEETEEDSDAGALGQSRRKTALGAGVEKYTRRELTLIPGVAG